MEYCGIDVHVGKSEVCVVNEAGRVEERWTVRTTRPALTDRFEGRERMRVAIEAGGSSPWVSRLLAGMGHEVIVCNPRRVRLIAESTRKKDTIDAEVLARLVRMDPEFLKPVVHRSEEAQLLRSRMTVRRALVQARTGWINTVRGLLRAFGHKVPGRNAESFAKRVGQVNLPPEVRQVVGPLLEQLDQVSGEIKRCDEELTQLAAGMPEVGHLQEIPGVGLLTALYFVLTIDDPTRFRCGRQVAAFLGLVPRLHESGEVSHLGRITKEGDTEARRLLVQAAHGVFRSRRVTALQRWGAEVAGRRGKGKAVVAVARKLVVIMHHLWVTGEVYQPFPESSAA